MTKEKQNLNFYFLLYFYHNLLGLLTPLNKLTIELLAAAATLAAIAAFCAASALAMAALASTCAAIA